MHKSIFIEMPCPSVAMPRCHGPILPWPFAMPQGWHGKYTFVEFIQIMHFSMYKIKTRTDKNQFLNFCKKIFLPWQNWTSSWAWQRFYAMDCDLGMAKHVNAMANTVLPWQNPSLILIFEKST